MSGFFDCSIPEGTVIDAAYKINRDSEYREDIRQALENMWERYSTYCPDTDFREDAVKHFQASAWQMEITLFFDSKFSLIPTHAVGPDVRFRQSNGEEILLEAVSAKPGTGADAVQEPRVGQVYHPDDEGIILRLRNAIDSKIKQHGRWIDAKVVQPNQPLILAVTAGEISTAVDFMGLSHMEHALFPLDKGAWHVPIDLNNGESAGPTEFKYGFRGSINKKNGSPISTDVFVTDAAEYVSAVLYNPHHFVNSLRMNGSVFRLIHNPNAKNPIPRGLIECGVEAWVENDHLHFKEWR